MTIWVEVTQGANSWRKSLSIHLEPRETKTLIFTFKEFSFWSLARAGLGGVLTKRRMLEAMLLEDEG